MPRREVNRVAVLLRMAERDPSTAYEIAEKIATGIGGFEKNEDEAKRLYRIAAQGGIAGAQYALAQRLLQHSSNELDGQEGRKWLEAAADQGVPAACASLASLLWNDNPADAARLYEYAANHDVLAALFYAGVCNLYAIGKSQVKEREGFAYLIKAANLLPEGSRERPLALYFTARCYLIGIGVGADAQNALQWFRAAAAEGHSEANFFLGECFELGAVGGLDAPGFKSNVRLARKHYLAASDQGHAEAIFRLALIDSSLDSNTPNKDKERKFQHALELAKYPEGDTAEICWFLFQAYFYAEGVGRDIPQAMKWLIRGADKGHPEATFHLAQCYETGALDEVSVAVNPDRERAYERYLRAADLGHEGARFWLVSHESSDDGGSFDYNFPELLGEWHPTLWPDREPEFNSQQDGGVATAVHSSASQALLSHAEHSTLHTSIRSMDPKNEIKFSQIESLLTEILIDEPENVDWLNARLTGLCRTLGRESRTPAATTGESTVRYSHIDLAENKQTISETTRYLDHLHSMADLPLPSLINAKTELNKLLRSLNGCRPESFEQLTRLVRDLQTIRDRTRFRIIMSEAIGVIEKGTEVVVSYDPVSKRMPRGRMAAFASGSSSPKPSARRVGVLPLLFQ